MYLLGKNDIMDGLDLIAKKYHERFGFNCKKMIS